MHLLLPPVRKKGNLTSTELYFQEYHCSIVNLTGEKDSQKVPKYHLSVVLTMIQLVTRPSPEILQQSEQWSEVEQYITCITLDENRKNIETKNW